MSDGDADENDATDPWGHLATSWDTDEGPRRYAAGAFHSLCEFLEAQHFPLAGASILDFGAGTGLLTDLLRHRVAEVVALDPSEGMRRRLETNAADWGNVAVVASLDHLDDLDESGDLDEPARFDLVVASSVLGFVDDYEGAVTALFEHLRPGGWLVQWDWERDFDERDEDERAETDGGSDEEPHGLTRDQVSSVLKRVGGIDVTVETGFSIEVDEFTMSPLMGAARKPDSSVDEG